MVLAACLRLRWAHAAVFVLSARADAACSYERSHWVICGALADLLVRSCVRYRERDGVGPWVGVVSCRRIGALHYLCIRSGRETRLNLRCRTRAFSCHFIGVLHRGGPAARGELSKQRGSAGREALRLCAAQSSQCRGRPLEPGGPLAWAAVSIKACERCGHASCLRAMRTLRAGCEARRAPVLCWRRVLFLSHSP